MLKIQKYALGDVVNIRFPNRENRKESTYHPAIVIEDLEDEVLLIFMTSKLHQQIHNKNSFVILKNSPEGMQMGLTYDSLICPDRKEPLAKIRIYPPPRGRCSQEMIERLEEFL